MGFTFGQFKNAVEGLGYRAIQHTEWHWQVRLKGKVIVDLWPSTGRYRFAGTDDRAKYGNPYYVVTQCLPPMHKVTTKVVPSTSDPVASHAVASSIETFDPLLD